MQAAEHPVPAPVLYPLVQGDDGLGVAAHLAGHSLARGGDLSAVPAPEAPVGCGPEIDRRRLRLAAETLSHLLGLEPVELPTAAHQRRELVQTLLTQLPALFVDLQPLFLGDHILALEVERPHQPPARRQALGVGGEGLPIGGDRFADRPGLRALLLMPFGPPQPGGVATGDRFLDRTGQRAGRRSQHQRQEQ